MSTAYETAQKAIKGGQAVARALWTTLSTESQRDGYALKPMPWEGSGEYQHVTYADGRDGFVRIPQGKLSLPSTSRFA